MGTGILTRKDPDKDPEDARRTDEIEQNYQTKAFSKFDDTPAIKQLRDKQGSLVSNGDGTFLVFRIGDSLYRVELTEL